MIFDTSTKLVKPEISILFTPLFTKPLAEQFPALSGTIPENVTVDNSFVNSTVTPFFPHMNLIVTDCKGKVMFSLACVCLQRGGVGYLWSQVPS